MSPRPAELAELAADLAAEQASLDALVAGLADADWERPTPAPGWSVRDQIGHLAFSEDLAALAATDEAAFGDQLAEALADLTAFERGFEARVRSLTPTDLLAWWRESRQRAIDAALAHDGDTRIPWVAMPMSPRAFLAARLMETWAHGHDVADALGTRHASTARLRHVAEIGVRTRRFSYANRGMEPPVSDVRVELAAPNGETWTWGAEDAADRVTGPAEDFCLVVTQRRNVADTGLEIAGEAAVEWMRIAQAFAGPPTERPPSRRAASS